MNLHSKFYTLYQFLVDVTVYGFYVNNLFYLRIITMKLVYLNG